MAAIIGAVPSTTVDDQLLAPLLTEAGRAAILLDVDGTLAPIVPRADDAHVPDLTRRPLITIARRYGLVACVSGRQAQAARRIVALGSIAYVGGHGAELLPSGATKVQVLPEVATHREAIQAFARAMMNRPQISHLQIRGEDKDTIYAFHWRGSARAADAARYAEQIAREAAAAGLYSHLGRMVLEIRAPVHVTKGDGVRRLLDDRPQISTALYAGDDRTDADAFATLHELREQGRLTHVVCVAVCSGETPPELIAGADARLDGPGAVRGLLEHLAEAG